MKRLIRAPYLTNVLLFIIACELLLLPRRKEVFTITFNREQNTPTIRRSEDRPTSFRS